MPGIDKTKAGKNGRLRDSELLDYLSERTQVECTDDNPIHQFTHPGDEPGTFRQALSLHILKARAKEAASQNPTPTP